jgi:hypothetical protein
MGSKLSFSSAEMITAPGDGRQIARLAALLVVLHELLDLLADDVPLIGLFARRDAPLEQIPVDLRLRRLLPAAPPACP